MSDRVIIRRGTTQDLGIFKELWMEFLKYQEKQGDLVLPNEHNLSIAASSFLAYVGGDVLGLVQFLNVNGKDVGVYMEGEVFGGYELSIGRYTVMRGIYFHPEHRGKGYTKLMYEKAMPWTYKNGLTGGITAHLTNSATVGDVTSAVVEDNFGGSEVKPYSVNLYWTFENPEKA